MNTREIMELALKLAGLEEIPADSVIITEGENIKRVLMGIDMDTPELLAAMELGYDLVIGHHPHGGSATINFHKVMLRQIDKMVEFGVPINKAQKALKERMSKIEYDAHSSNYDRLASFARLLDIPYMNIHIPCDIITENFLQKYINQKFEAKPRTTLKEVVDALLELPEYKKAITKPAIRVGSPEDFAGKIAVLMAGGTNGGEKVFKAYFEAGVGTIICMHLPEDVKKAVIEQNIGNVIVAGHMASDSIGINIFAEELKKRGLEVHKIGGIIE